MPKFFQLPFADHAAPSEGIDHGSIATHAVEDTQLG